MCDNGECGMCMGYGEAILAASALSTAGSAYNANATNNANQAIAGTNTAANAFMQVQNQQFNADQAQLNRYYNSEEAFAGRKFQADVNAQNRDFANQTMDKLNTFNAGEAQKNRDYQTEMANSQYQRAVGDLKAAGLNPMLAYKNGGNAAPSGSMASGGAVGAQGSGSGNASASQASSGGWAGPGQWTAQQANLGPAGTSAMAALEMTKKMEMYDAQIKNVNSQTLQIESNIPKTIAETAQIKEQTAKTIEETKNVAATLPQIVASTKLTISQDQVAQAQAALTKQQAHLTAAQTKVTTGQLSIQELQKIQIQTDTMLSDLKGTGQAQENRIRELAVIGATAANPAATKAGEAVQSVNPYKWGQDFGNWIKKAW